MKKFILTAIAAGFILPNVVNSQCNSYSKRQCKPSLDPYSSVQISSTLLRPGDVAEVMLTFYSGQTYRLLVCSQEQLGDVGFKLYDTDKALIHESEANSDAKSFDFKVASTQQLILEVEIPMTAQAVSGVADEGCISVIIGMAQKD